MLQDFFLPLVGPWLGYFGVALVRLWDVAVDVRDVLGRLLSAGLWAIPLLRLPVG